MPKRSAIDVIARFVTRGAGKKGGAPVDLILGAAMKGQKAFKPCRIYELRAVLGEIILVEIGPSALGPTPDTSAIGGTSWHHDISHIMRLNGKHIYLTYGEYKEQCERGRKAKG